MKLKSIELYGFKSFAQRSKLHFEKDICAIVGPNGSGKSNISDAIRWVLGEQSAKSLRGSNMQDVIFSGTQTKNQMNMASVSLTLDNRDKTLPIDFDEVNVTRKVYRTGESEYLLNKANVRLRDIKELFLDTGIGKDGYSIIGQGRIDDILSTRSEDRRYIFEEASGIAKFKYNKTDAERKLAKNEESLQEIRHELKIKKQEVDMLETQANNAKQGVKLNALLERQELSLLKFNLKKLDDQVTKNKASLVYCEEELDIKNKKLMEINRRLSPFESVIEEKRLKIQSMKEEVIEKDKRIVSIKSKITNLTDRVDFQQKDYDRIKSDIAQRQDKIEANKEKIDEFEIKSDDLIKRETDLTENYSQLKKEKEKLKIKIKELESQLEEKDQRFSILNQRLSQMTIDKSTKEQLDRNYLMQKQVSLDQRNQLENVILNTDQKIEDKKKELNLVENKLSSQAEELTSLMDNRSNKRLALDKVKKDLSLATNEFYRLDSQRDFLSQIYYSYEGFNRSVQNLLKAKDKNKELDNRIVGVLAELIELPDEYKLALDVAMGGSLQNIVVKDEVDAKYLINFIKEKKYGRITFLPINKIKATKTQITHPLIIGSLNNLISYQPEIEAIIDHFLARTVLVDNMDDAIIVSKQLKGVRVVTLDGEIINSWGSMVGGNVYKKEKSSLINRKKELDQLHLRLKKGKAYIDKKQEEERKLSKDLEAIHNQLNELDIKNIKETNIQSQLITQMKELEIELSFHKKARQEIEEKLENLDFSLKEEDYTSMESLEEDHRNLLSEKQADQEKLDQQQQEYQDSDRELYKLEADLAVCKRDKQIVTDSIDALLADNEDLQHFLKIDRENVKLIQKNIDESLAEISKLKDQIQDETDSIKRQENDLTDLENELSEQESKIKTDLAMAEQYKEEINLLDRQLFELKLKVEADQNKEDEYLTSYSENYDIPVVVIKEKLHDLESIKVSRRDIIETKNKLNQIGYFNYASIEKYQDSLESLNFIQGQYDDLIASRQDIIKMIKKLELDMTRLFKESFNKINDKFSDVFKVLFNGGEASLLLDGDDVLTAGIEIIAKPPGKKLKHLGLLSGGEKALTAVALLFAIFEINPAPFCVLDEIDAALDEANIKRYISYLNNLTNKTQFIIITHRKVTMEMADILYGVTMEEKGVSKVITLALDDYEEVI